jgi:hypothetical protein
MDLAGIERLRGLDKIPPKTAFCSFSGANSTAALKGRGSSHAESCQCRRERPRSCCLAPNYWSTYGFDLSGHERYGDITQVDQPGV